MSDDPLTDEMRAVLESLVIPKGPPESLELPLSDTELRAVRKLIQANGLGEGPGSD